MSIQDAVYELAKLGITVTHVTLYKWVKEHELGIRPAGPRGRIYIVKEKWEKFLNEYIKRDQ
jgi:transposase-like protein